jgi:hypothetical protein
MDSQSPVIYFSKCDSENLGALLMSLTRWMGVRAVSFGISLTENCQEDTTHGEEDRIWK